MSPYEVVDTRTIPLVRGFVILNMNVNKNRFNKGTKYGAGLILQSLKTLGCGRSVLCDKRNIIIAGNNVYEAAVKLGKKVVVVESDADTLVVVKRTDVDAESTVGLELSLVDNLSQEKNLEWDADKLHDCMNKSLSFDPRRWGGYECLVKDLDLDDFFPLEVVKKQTPKEQPLFVQNTQLSLFNELNNEEE